MGLTDKYSSLGDMLCSAIDVSYKGWQHEVQVTGWQTRADQPSRFRSRSGSDKSWSGSVAQQTYQDRYNRTSPMTMSWERIDRSNCDCGRC